MGRSFRLLATGVSFAIFGLGAMLISGLVLSVIAVASANTSARQRRARACIAAAFRVFLKLIELLGLARLDIDAEALRKLSAEHGSIIVANHPSLLDVVVLLAHVAQSNCVIKDGVRRNPLLACGVRIAGYIPNSDPEKLVTACERALRQKEVLIVFPEATRTVPGRPMRLQRGAASIALRTDAALRVVHIRCEPTLLAKGDPWYRVPDRQPCFVVRVGGSVRARDYLREDENRGIAVRRLTRALQRELCKEIWLNESAGTRAEATPH